MIRKKNANLRGDRGVCTHKFGNEEDMGRGVTKEKMAHMRMKIPQVAFMPQMAMGESQLMSLSLGERKRWSRSKQYSKIRDCRFLSLPALIWRSWRSVSCPGVGALSAVPASRRSVGCPGVSGAVRRCPALSGAVPAIQTLRALQPVQSLIRVPSDKAFTRRPSLFSNPEEKSRGEKWGVLWFLSQIR